MKNEKEGLHPDRNPGSHYDFWNWNLRNFDDAHEKYRIF